MEELTKSSNMTDSQVLLKENYNNRFIVLSKENYAVIKRPLLVVFHQFNENYIELKTWLDMLYKIAAQFTPESVQFAIADFEDLPIFSVSWDDLDYFGFGADMPPYVFAVDSSDHQFQYEGNVIYDDLVLYVQQLVDGKLWRTQAIPEDTEENESSMLFFKTIVASNFEKCVFENDKHVLVTFHSNYSFQLYNRKRIPKIPLNGSDNLVLYKYNAQKNYLPLEYKIRNLPTSMLIPQNAKNKRVLFEHNKDNIGVYYSGSNFRHFLATKVLPHLNTIFDCHDDEHEFKDAERNDLLNFLKENYKSRIQALSKRNYGSIQRPFLVFYQDLNNEFLQLKEWTDLLYEMVNHFSKTIVFAVADFDDLSIFHATLDDQDLFDIEYAAPPLVFAVDIHNNQFCYNGTITRESLFKYCEQLESSELYKTESIPHENENAIIKTLVASNIWETIDAEDKDVIVTFYTQSFNWERPLNQVIEELKCDLAKLSFYKYNAEANYLPLELKIEDFPTSMLVPSNDKSKRLFFNHLDHLVYDNFEHPYYEDLIEFLAKNISTELTDWNRKGQRLKPKRISTSDDE